MRFSSTALSVAIASASVGNNGADAFSFCNSRSANSLQRSSNVAFTTSSMSTSARGAMSMDLSDLESKLLTAPEPVKGGKKAPSPKPKRESKKEREAREQIEREEADAKAEAELRAKEAEEAAKNSKVSKPSKKNAKKSSPNSAYDLDTGAAKKKAAPVKISQAKRITERPKPKAKPSSASSGPSLSFPKVPKLSKPKSPSAPAAKEENALLGVPLGLAPLVAVPIVGLSALRSGLSKTQARRAAIEAEIVAAEEARKKKELAADTDGEAAVKALGFLGAAGAAAVITITAPFAGMIGGEAPLALPKASTPAVTKTVNAPAKKPASKFSAPKPKAATTASGKKISVGKSQKEQGYNFDDVSTVSKKAAPKKISAATKKADADEVKADALKEKADADEVKAAEIAADKEAAIEKKNKADAEKLAAEKVAREKEAADKKATEEAKKKEDAAKAAAEKAAKEEAAANKAGADKAEALKAKAAEDEAKAAKAAADKEAAEEAKKKADYEKTAAERVAREKEAADKKATDEEKKLEAAAKEAKAKADKEEAMAKEAKTNADKEEAAAKAKDSAAKEAAPAAKKKAAGPVGVVTGGESGGKVLQAETVDDSVKDFLKKYQK